VEAVRQRTDAACKKALEMDVKRRERRRKRRSRSRTRHRRGRDDSSSSRSRSSFDELSDEEEEAEVFRLARDLPAGLASLSRRIPGGLLKTTLSKMRGYLETRRATAGGHEDEYTAPCSVFFQTVQMPNAAPPLPQRMVRELRTLCCAVDLIISGQGLMAADVLVQRMKSLEQAHQEGSWRHSDATEIIPPGEISIRGGEERALCARLMRDRQRDSRNSSAAGYVAE
jgi:hypothetical protein